MTAGFYLALAPWLAFVVVDRSAGMGPDDSALFAAALSLIVVGREVKLRSLHLLPLLGLCLFGGLSALAAGFHNPSWMARDDRALVFGALCFALVASMLRQPLTSPYGRETPSARRASVGTVRRHHLRVTLRWVVATAAIAASFTIANFAGGPFASTLFDWLLPIGFVIAAAVWSPPTPAAAGDEAGAALTLMESFLSRPARRSVPAPSGSPSLRLVAGPPNDPAEGLAEAPSRARL